MKGIWKYTAIFLVLILPSIVLQLALIHLFPYTGLGRILSVPATLILNSTFITLCMMLNRKYGNKILNITAVLILNIVLTIGLYPQEFNPPILVQSIEAVKAIQDFDHITIEDLGNSGDVSPPRYVVALYKFKDELLSEGVYQLYNRENVYFYNYSIKNLDEIPSKLIGYHKVMWWYLNF